MSEANQDPAIKGTTVEHVSQRRMLASEAIQRGRIPGRPAERMWGGKGDGTTCSVCSLDITAQDIGYELEFGSDGQRATTRYLHISCFAAWEFACRNGNAGSIAGPHDEESPELPKLNGHSHGPEPW
jgi:hypothetical protein